MVDLITFSYKDDKKELVEEFKRIADREGKKHSHLIMELMTEYVKNHSSGNSTFKIDEFVNKSDFLIAPAFDTDPQKWRKFYEDSTSDDRLKLKTQITGILKHINNVDFNSENIKKDPIAEYLEKKRLGQINE